VTVLEPPELADAAHRLATHLTGSSR
jgi:hypothetical protein